MDGAENVAVFSVAVGNQTPIDSVQEYSVVTNNFSAEYGRASGGVVNLTTKSGTNQIHGSGWEFNRLSAYTANTYANDAANQAAGSIVAPKGSTPAMCLALGRADRSSRTSCSSSRARSGRESGARPPKPRRSLIPPSLPCCRPMRRLISGTYGTGAVPASGAVVTAGQLTNAGLTVGPINGTTAVSPGQPVFDVVNFKVPFDAGGDVPQNTYSLVGRVDFNPSDKTTMYAASPGKTWMSSTALPLQRLPAI